MHLNYEIDIFKYFPTNVNAVHTKSINYAEFIGNEVCYRLSSFMAAGYSSTSSLMLHHMVPCAQQKLILCNADF